MKKNNAKVLGLDISTKTIGWALFDIVTEELLELTHFSPVVKPKPDDKLEELIYKATAFEKRLIKYKDIGITKIIIEEPLLNSNNIWTVGTLLRFNSMICKSIYDVFGVIPSFISTYNSRKYAWDELVGVNEKGQKVLFGGFDKKVDKKVEVWKLVKKAEPQLKWEYTRFGNLKKEHYDQSDAYTCVKGYMKKEKLW